MSATEERKALLRLSQAVRNLVTGAPAGALLTEPPPTDEPPPEPPPKPPRSPGPSGPPAP